MTVGLWIRTYSDYVHRRVMGDAETQSLLSQVSEAQPFVTLLRGDPAGDHLYFQILGQDLDHLLVEGGGLVDGREWQWRASRAPRDRTLTSAGPEHHRLNNVRTDQLLDLDSAMLFAEAALSDWGGLRGPGPEIPGHWLTWNENLDG